MKYVLLVLFTISFYLSNATTYYFSNRGDDINDGTSASRPWQTISKFNSIFSTKKPGDKFLFRRGDVFYGTLVISISGLPNMPVTIGAYGTGANPVITGLKKIVAWTRMGRNLWESTTAVSNLLYTNLVTVDGKNVAMGRTPNTGSYYTFQSHTGITSIESSDLKGTIDWSGAEVALNLTSARIVRNKIINQSSGVLTFIQDPEGVSFQSNNQKFIIQNDPRTLDTANEWYFNPTTKKMWIYETGRPSDVRVATLDSLAVISGNSYIIFDGLSFEGGNTSLIKIDNSSDITIQNCDFKYAGREGIYGTKKGDSHSLMVQGCTFNYINNNAIDLPRLSFTHATLSRNVIKNCAVLYGMIDRNDGVNDNGTAQAISANGHDMLIEKNIIDSVGYIGIHFLESNTTIRNNFIKNYCLLLDDGGAIYTWNGVWLSVKSNIKISDNITINSNILSAVNTGDYGIYLDDFSNGVEVFGNTCANSGWGMEIHNGCNIYVHDNTFFNNSMASVILESENFSGHKYLPGKINMDRIIFKNNIFFAKTLKQKTLWIYPKIKPLVPIHFQSDSNYFIRPADIHGAAILTNFNNEPDKVVNHTLSHWQSLSGADANSVSKSLNTNDVLFEYNAGASDKTILLPSKYSDVQGRKYSQKVTLAPFTSVILIRD